VGLPVEISIQAGGQPPAIGLLPSCGLTLVLSSAPPFQIREFKFFAAGRRILREIVDAAGRGAAPNRAIQSFAAERFPTQPEVAVNA